MEIASSGLNFQLSLIDINLLKPHEEVTETWVETIARGSQTQGFVRDPLIVDRDDLVILDGMHRFNSLKHLKCRFAPCCLVNYDSPLIRIGAWFRLFNVREPESIAEKVLKSGELNFTREKISPDQLAYTSRAIILADNGTQYFLPQSPNLVEVTRTAVKLEKAIVREGYHVDYLPEDIAIQNLKSSTVNLVISVPIFTKQQIREFGISGQLLPHKVTRHVMPSRPLRIDVPMKLLCEQDISEAEANRKFGDMLLARHVNRKPPGSVVDGRRYEEELLVFAP